MSEIVVDRPDKPPVMTAGFTGLAAWLAWSTQGYARIGFAGLTVLLAAVVAVPLLTAVVTQREPRGGLRLFIVPEARTNASWQLVAAAVASAGVWGAAGPLLAFVAASAGVVVACVVGDLRW